MRFHVLEGMARQRRFGDQPGRCPPFAFGNVHLLELLKVPTAGAETPGRIGHRLCLANVTASDFSQEATPPAIIDSKLPSIFNRFS